MRWWQRLFRIEETKRVKIGSAVSPRAVAGGRARTRGRKSVDSASDTLAGNWMIVPPPDHASDWRFTSFDDRMLDGISPTRLLQMAADLSPEISRALWDFHRLCNPGWEIKALRLGSEDIEDSHAKRLLDAFIAVLDERHGVVDVLFGRLFTGAFMGGALWGELVLDRRGRIPLDIATPDPASARFRKRKDDELGTVWELGQWQGGEFVPLVAPTIRYVPIDPAIGSPYGRPMAAPALFTSLFLLAMLHDLKRVIQQQGYPRIDLSIDLERIIGDNPDLNDPVKAKELVDSVIQAVQDAYAQLEPDDAYVHSDAVAVNQPVGTVDADSLGAVDALIKALERMATRALKTMPLLMGIAEGTSEANANRQWELHAAGIKSIQHYAENLLERLFTLALEVQGVQAKVEFRFAELRAAEELRDEQVRMLKIQNARALYDHGYNSQDESSMLATGHPAHAPAPRTQAVGAQFVEDDGDGQERTGWVDEIRAARVEVAA